MNAHPEQLEKHLTLEEKKAKYGLMFRIRQWFVDWLMKDTHLVGVNFGENTITLSPSGVADVARWSATGTPAQLGDLTVDADTTGRPQWYDGAIQSAASLQDVDSRIAVQVNGGGAGVGFVGSATAAEINAASPLTGDSYVAEDAVQPSAGTSDTPAIGDVLEYDGTSWIRIITQVGGFPPDGTRLLVATTTTFIAGGGLTSSQDEGKIAVFDGTALTPASLTDPDDGVFVSVACAGCVNDAKAFVYNGSTPTGVWVQSGGVGTAHSGLSGLAADDHTQYALLAGRSGGQILIGGSATTENLLLESNTSNDGEVILADLVFVNENTSRVGIGGTNPLTAVHISSLLTGQEMRLGGATCGEVLPATDNTGSIGNGTRKFNLVRATTVTSGDHNFLRPDRGAAWTITEFQDGLYAVNRVTGKWFQLGMTPCAPRCPDSELAPVGDDLAAIAAK